MRYTHVYLVLTFVGWLSSGGISAMAQDPSLSLVKPLSEDTAIVMPSGEPQTPQFLRVTIGLGAGGGSIQLHYDPAWVNLHRPQVHVEEVPPKQVPADDVAPSPEDGADELRQTLERALARAQPSAESSP